VVVLALAILALGGCAACAVRRSVRWSTRLGVTSAVAGCLVGLIPAGRVLLGAPSESLRVPWDVPYGAFFVTVDPLSAFFLLPIFGLSALAAIYGGHYMLAYRDEKALGISWCFFNLLVASMALVVIAQNAILFLVAWEVMALASFLLVVTQDDDEDVRDAGRTYLIASHLGTAFLLALFILLGRGNGSLDFDGFAAGPNAGLLFILAAIGFGTKAGFVPLHVWLPEAHPAAPSHVSAVMSGVMIKTGIYGLVRTLTLLGPLPAWVGWLLVGVGVTSGVLGVLFALAQQDLKRLLAYSSVENVGIITLGLGLGLVGLHVGFAPLAVLGFAGALLHVLNHTLFKGLLFLGAGAVLHGTKTRDMEALGGLLKRMPWTGSLFLIGSAALAGLPPLNGFVSEFLLYAAAFTAAASLGSAAAVPALAAIGALALIGGLAAACFAKAFGVVFLGEPRSDHAAHAHEQGIAMRAPMVLLATACVVIGVLSPWLVGRLAPVLEAVTGLPGSTVRETLGQVTGVLGSITFALLGLLALVGVLLAVRRAALAGKPLAAGPTWDCGYALPSPRMQYTASSFAQPLTTLFAPLLGTRRRASPPSGFFPQAAFFETTTPDFYRERLYAPLFASVQKGLSAFRWLQHGRVQLYVLYIALALLVLLVWKLW
jgi:formate hydrogenlyase subunit 3/multisubunit Na+/H+ antiporter MnhD subunit